MPREANKWPALSPSRRREPKGIQRPRMLNSLSSSDLDGRGRHSLAPGMWRGYARKKRMAASEIFRAVNPKTRDIRLEFDERVPGTGKWLRRIVAGLSRSLC